MGRGLSKRSSWLGQRSNLEKTLLSLVCVLTVTLVIVLIVGVAKSGSDSETSIVNDQCSSQECFVTAGRVLSQMKLDADPCRDLYTFACGRRQRFEVSSKRKAINNLYQQIRYLLEYDNEGSYLDPVRAFYKTCMNFEGIKGDQLLDLMIREGLGDWPYLVAGISEETQTSVSDRLAALAMMDVDVAFSATPIPDPDEQGKFILEIGPGNPFLDSNHTAESIRSDVKLQEMIKYTLYQLSGNSIRANTATINILDVEGYFLTVAQTHCNTTTTLVAETALSELSRLIPEMNWSSLIDRIRVKAGLNQPFGIRLRCRQQIRDYLIHLVETSHPSEKETFNYLGWRFFLALAPHVRGRLPSSDPPRWVDCVKEAERAAGPALSKALLPPTEVTEKSSMVEEKVLSALNQLSEKASWLSHDLKKVIHQQLKASKETHWIHTSSQQMDLSKVSISNYTSVVVNLRKQQIVNRWKKLNPSNRALPTELYLTSDSSSTDVPYLLLDKVGEPYLDTSSPQWMNFGGFGVFTAFKHLKQLETVGESPLKERLYWQDSSAANCLRQMSGPILNMNESESFMKDLFFEAGALEAAFEAASGSGPDLPGLSRYNDQQLFFISYAQTQCEPKYSQLARHRVNTLASSSPTFDKAFECQSQQPKCFVWS